MTIPQIENEIRILHEEDKKKSGMLEHLQCDLSELRQQLEVAPIDKPRHENEAIARGIPMTQVRY